MSAPASLLSTSAPVSVSPSPKRFLRILYADDVRELRDVARLSFSREGHGIECFEDGAAGLRRVTADPAFDLVITDHQMPVMNGLEFVRNLREIAFAGKIMVFSSDLSTEVASEYRRLEVDRVLYKPIFPSEMRQIIAEMFPATVKRTDSDPRAPVAAEGEAWTHPAEGLLSYAVMRGARRVRPRSRRPLKRG